MLVERPSVCVLASTVDVVGVKIEYIGYMFRILNSHLQAYSLQLSHRMLCTHWDPSVFTSVK